MFQGAQIEDIVSKADQKAQKEWQQKLLDSDWCEESDIDDLVTSIEAAVDRDKSFVFGTNVHLQVAEIAADCIFISVFMKFVHAVLKCTAQQVKELLKNSQLFI